MLARRSHYATARETATGPPATVRRILCFAGMLAVLTCCSGCRNPQTTPESDKTPAQEGLTRPVAKLRDPESKPRCPIDDSHVEHGTGVSYILNGESRVFCGESCLVKFLEK